MVSKEGILLKKKYGQHFLKEQWVIDEILKNVDLNNQSSVFEIGPGSGFLTQSILKKDIERLWSFEIDSDWVHYLQENIKDKRFKILHENILDTDFKIFEENKPWTLLSNLPYQITFPILHLLQRNMHLLKEGVIMVQEEVGQKIVKTSGRGYGFISLFFQYYFSWKILAKISPEAFEPPPKVYSRLLYFKPNFNRQHIENEEQFWKFIKIAFHQPRRTLRNNLLQMHYDMTKIPENILQLRAQQMSMQDLLQVWDLIR